MHLTRSTLTTLAVVAIAAGGLAADENTTGVEIPETPKFDTSDAAAHGKAIATFADGYDRGWRDEVTRGRMTLFDAGGDSVERTFSRMAYERADEGDKLIIRFLSPAEINGVAALTFENPGSSDDNWLYLPATKRVRRVSGANNTASFQGTEFTYEDLGNLDPVEFEWRFVEETTLTRDDQEVAVYKLDAKPTYSDTGYSRLAVYYSKDGFRQERIDYYDKAGELLKTRQSSDWRLMHGRFWRAYRIEMTNHLTDKRTLLVQERYFLNLSLYTSKKTGKPRENLPESLFTTQSLQK